MKTLWLFPIFFILTFVTNAQVNENDILKIKSETKKRCLVGMSPCGGTVCGYFKNENLVYIESILNGENDKCVTLFFVNHKKLYKVECYYFSDKTLKNLKNNSNFEKISFGKTNLILTKKEGKFQKLTNNKINEIENKLLECFNEILVELN